MVKGLLHWHPPPHTHTHSWRSVNTQTYAYVGPNHAEKHHSWAPMLHADTCWNIWIHDSRLLTEERTAIRVILVWSMPHRWGRPCMLKQWCGALLILPCMHTRHWCFRAARITFDRKWIRYCLNVLVTLVGKANDKKGKKAYVCTCIEMNRAVCVLSSDWSATRMAPREDIGRGQTRLFQIDLSEWASGRPNWLDKGNTFLPQVPLFYCARAGQAHVLFTGLTGW